MIPINYTIACWWWWCWWWWCWWCWWCWWWWCWWWWCWWCWWCWWWMTKNNILAGNAQTYTMHNFSFWAMASMGGEENISFLARSGIDQNADPPLCLQYNLLICFFCQSDSCWPYIQHMGSSSLLKFSHSLLEAFNESFCTLLAKDTKAESVCTHQQCHICSRFEKLHDFTLMAHLPRNALWRCC